VKQWIEKKIEFVFSELKLKKNQQTDLQRCEPHQTPVYCAGKSFFPKS